MEQLMSLLPVIAIYGGFFALLWYFLIRPQKKKQEEVNKMRSELKAGDEIVTIGGIVGKIVRVKEDRVHLEVIKGANHMVVSRWAIGEVVSSKASSKKGENEALQNDEIVVNE